MEEYKLKAVYIGVIHPTTWGKTTHAIFLYYKPSKEQRLAIVKGATLTRPVNGRPLQPPSHEVKPSLRSERGQGDSD